METERRVLLGLEGLKEWKNTVQYAEIGTFLPNLPFNNIRIVNLYVPLAVSAVLVSEVG